MVDVSFQPSFKKLFSKIKDEGVKERMLKQLSKIRENPDIGKPMRYSRKGTREVYVAPFRLSYLYLRAENKIIILDLYHKDTQ